MNRNDASDRRRGVRGTVAGQQWQRRRMRPTVLTLESRTLLSNWFVNSANSGSADGLTPDTGFTTIQAAISIANAGDTILVETGDGYNESDTVFVPDLTIEADDGQSPVLDGSFPSFQGSAGFTVIADDVTIAGFTIQNFSGSSAVDVQSGSSLNLNSDTIQENFAFGSGGGVDNTGGSIALNNCTISGNSAESNGGGVYNIDGSTTLSNCTISGNSANFSGGGVFNSGFLTVQFSNFSANRASLSGGAIDNFDFGDFDLLDSGFTGNSAGTGGAFGNTGGEGSISGCNFSNNRAVISFDSGRGGGGIAVSSGSLTIANTTLADNTSETAAGGLLVVQGGVFVNNSTLTNNTADSSGGGLLNSGTTTLTNSTVSGNTAGTGNGGGAYNRGAAYNDGTLTLTDCTVSGNLARNGNGGGVYNNGGAYDINGFNNGTTTLTNCTISGNSAAYGGGGVYNSDGIKNVGTTTLTNCTVSGNSSTSGGGIDNVSGTVNTGNTIVAQNTATTSGPDALGTVASQGNNLIGATDGSSGWVSSDLIGTIAQPLDPLLAPLNNYGGPTQTMALLPGSPAIDAGNNDLVPTGITTDQRGFLRIVNGTVDIGAFESSGFTISVTSGSGQSTGVLTAFAAPLVVTVTANFSSDPVAGGLVTFTPPPSGASATLNGSPATISANGEASSIATANGIVGSYTVSATASGITTSAKFNLNNYQLILALDPSAPGALGLTNNASITTSGVVYVDSSSSSALSASGNAKIKAAAIDVHGGVKKSGNASLSPAPVTGAAVLAAATLPLPSIKGVTNHGSFSIGGNSSEKIQPGIYSQISVSGNAKLTMSSGIYIIEGGGFSVSGNAGVTGAGVMIFNAGSKYPGTGGTYGSVALSGNSTYNLSPATSGIYAGIVFFQPRDNTKTITVSVDASGITGTMYAPGAQLSLSGNGAINVSLIVDALAISGNGIADVASKSGSSSTGGGPATPLIRIKVTDAMGNNVIASNLPAVSLSAVGPDGTLVPQSATENPSAGNLLILDPTTGTYKLSSRMKWFKPGS